MLKFIKSGYNKVHQKKYSNTRYHNAKNCFGCVAIRVLDSMRFKVTDAAKLKREILKITKVNKTKIKSWFPVVPVIPMTHKKEKSRMGKGVGDCSHLVFILAKGDTICEFESQESKLRRRMVIYAKLYRGLKKLFPIKLRLQHIRGVSVVY